jgi:hypothetical protein
MNNIIKMIKPLLFLIFMTSCSSPQVSDYKDTTPNLILEEFFDGSLSAYGMVLDQNGKLSRRFTVKLEAQWNKNKGTINEWFTFDDGEKSTRIWQLTRAC